MEDLKLGQGGEVIGEEGLKSKLMESETLAAQARNNSKEQFSNSPNLMPGLEDAIMDAFAAHSEMSKQALADENVRRSLLALLLGPGGLYEALRNRSVSPR